MTKLYDLIAANPQLEYVDAATGQHFGVSDLTHTLDLEPQHGLAFLYLDNSIAAIEALLNFLDSPFTIALLSPKLNIAYKQQLEQLYRPCYIYDPSRTAVEGFEATVRLFKNTVQAGYSIHPDIKVLLSTSGTTGSPKFVKLSEDNLVQNALSIIDYLPIQHHDVTPLTLPVFYSYGLSVFTTNSIAGGQVVCTSRDVVQKEFWEDFNRYGYTSVAGVPYVYEMLHRIGFCKKEYASLRYMTQAGGRLSPVLAKTFGEYMAVRDKRFYIMYGQTEATARMAYLPPEALLSKAGSIGIPVKNGRFDISPDTQELVYTGPNVFGGYATGTADLQTFDHHPVLYTGDMAEKDADGYYYITGRMKRFVKLFGTRVNLDEVEAILKNTLNGGTVACIGVEDKYLLVQHLGALDSSAIKQLLSEKLQLHVSVFRIQQVDEFLLTPNGKVDYTAMQQMGLAEKV
ncbi:Acyl-CoA synthetase (AMP-forming)/AMP-acid ligase II [Chitinophaga rupis]|uniref:Acyl-CoA synthetase (AMP-forming)/AMP-acid ligase II n=1 Tax=Chitinophaga rupis TaxID=573321 RepID=A0A1H8HK03_9BACT|nr:AMP-binding protein [Chitinophaga rupis]SEN56459.1 Acyl-CoA synthetase (AMP-forming)/AMP-acid ligase II [Chitinophaga rupis]